jgi:type I restriction enzyme R subunit
MIVVRSRRDVVTYHSVLRQLVKNRKVQWAVFGALSSGIIESSGRQKDSEISPNQTLVNENELNGHVSLELADIIIVCDKLDTGYNDPNLNAMYIDRFIRSSIHMVQLLSRLNRRSKGR